MLGGLVQRVLHVDVIPLSFIFFFKSGSFAWNGIFGFYRPFVTFWIWFVVMTYRPPRAAAARGSHTVDAAKWVSLASKTRS